jgi:aminobenzoyl-glutamate utilization protein B
VELMNVGINYMREHMPDDARVHYAYLDAGGEAPNVVQAKATVRQLVRARTNRELLGLVERVRRIGEGAALMTETRVEATVVSAVSNVLGNGPLEEAMEAEMERLGPPVFDEADRAFARAIQATLTPAHLADAFRRTGRAPVADQPLADFVVPLAGSATRRRGRRTWATCPGRCRRCRPGSRPAPSGRRSTAGS